MAEFNKLFLEDRCEMGKINKFSKGRKKASPNLKKILKKKRMGLIRNFLKFLMGPTLPCRVYFNVHIVPRLAPDQRT